MSIGSPEAPAPQAPFGAFGPQEQRPFMPEQPINAAPQTDLFGNQLPEGHVATVYSAETAAKDTEDLRLLVGRVLVETAVRINDEEVAAQLTADAERFMKTWEIEEQFKEHMRRRMFDEAHVRAEEARMLTEKHTGTKSKKLRSDWQKPGRYAAPRRGSRLDSRRPDRAIKQHVAQPSRNPLVKS